MGRRRQKMMEDNDQKKRLFEEGVRLTLFSRKLGAKDDAPTRLINQTVRRALHSFYQTGPDLSETTLLLVGDVVSYDLRT
jgi:hypothetical protein